MSHRRRRKGGNESRNMLLHCWGRARHWTPLLRARPTKQQSPCELFYGICLSVRPFVCLSVPSFRQSRHRHTMRISFSHFVFLQAKIKQQGQQKWMCFSCTTYKPKQVYHSSRMSEPKKRNDKTACRNEKEAKTTMDGLYFRPATKLHQKTTRPRKGKNTYGPLSFVTPKKKVGWTCNWQYAIGVCPSNQTNDNPYRIRPSACLCIISFRAINHKEKKKEGKKKGSKHTDETMLMLKW